jgi:Flp pilus assembly protein TadG
MCVWRNVKTRDARRPAPRSRQRGTAVVEFALVLPLFAALLFGVIEYGWVFYQRFNIAASVRDGLRQGVTVSQHANPDPQSVAVTRAQADLLAAGIDPNTVTLDTQYLGIAPTKTMTVTATMAYQPLIGLIPTPHNLQYTMTMMLELQ